jgi:hypothetical protein
MNNCFVDFLMRLTGSKTDDSQQSHLHPQFAAPHHEGTPSELCFRKETLGNIEILSAWTRMQTADIRKGR